MSLWGYKHSASNGSIAIRGPESGSETLFYSSLSSSHVYTRLHVNKLVCLGLVSLFFVTEP